MNATERHDPLVIAWDVRCASEEDLRAVSATLESQSCPTAIVEDIATSGSDSEQVAVRTRHHVGEYFETVRSLPGDDPLSLRVVFQRRPDAGRFWKDVMVRVLQTLRNAASHVSIRRDFSDTVA